MKNTLSLAFCLGMACAGAAFSSNDLNDNQVPAVKAKTYTPPTLSDLQAQNNALQAQLAQMQTMFAQLSARVAEQSAQIASVPDPKAIERATVRHVIQQIGLPTDELSDSDSEDGPPLNYNFNYVEDRPALLAQLKKLARSAYIGDEDAAQARTRVAELEKELGITGKRLKKQKEKLEQEHRQREEQLRRELEASHQNELRALYETIALNKKDAEVQLEMEKARSRDLAIDLHTVRTMKNERTEELSILKEEYAVLKGKYENSLDKKQTRANVRR